MSLREGTLPNGVTYKWLAAGVTVAPCDACHRRVWTTEARLQIHDGKGPQRPGGKGSNSTYLCRGCAYRIHLIEAPEHLDREPESDERETESMF